MHPFLNIALRAAREASDLILEALARPDRIRIQEKGPNDFVTDVDQAVEELLVQQIRRAYPDHGFLCEESGEIVGKDPDTRWIIDPIDGTRNFIHGFPHFCIAIACVQKGKVQHGLIVDPVRGDEFSATRGNGARLNDLRMRVSPTRDLNQAIASLASAGKDNYQQLLHIQEHLQGRISGLRFTGSSALDLAYVAAGRLDAGWMAGMQLWDYAAGALMVQEAGGLISDGHGNPEVMEAKSLVFGTPRCYRQMLPAVKS